MNTNLKKKALLPLVAMVLVSVIAFSGVTYAWFTTSNFATVSSLDVNVKAADGIQISLDGYNWKSTLSVDEIKNAVGNKLANYASNSNQYPAEAILPVSTTGTTNANGQMMMFLGELNNDALKTTILTDGTNSNYIAFDLFFKMAKDDTVVSVDTNGSSVTDPTNAIIHSSYSARVGFVNYGKADTASAAQGLKTAADVKIWEPNAGNHISTDIAGKQSYQGVALEANDALTTDGALAPVTTVDFSQDAELFTFDKGINKIRVYIWMEGQDVDCINDASGGAFITNLKFSQPTTNA